LAEWGGVESRATGVSEPARARTERHSNLANLEVAFGSSLCIPSEWPSGYGNLSCYLDVFPNGRRVYRVVVAGGAGSDVSILGFSGGALPQPGRRGWHLASLGSDVVLVRECAGRWEAALERSGLRVQVLNYPSRPDVLWAAQHLVDIDS